MEELTRILRSHRRPSLLWPYGMVILDKRQAGTVCRAEGVRWRRRPRPSKGGDNVEGDTGGCYYYDRFGI